MSDVLDDIDDGTLDDFDGDDERDQADANVCDYIADGADEPCGQTFDTPGKLNQHRALVHKLRKDGTKIEPGGGRPRKATGATKKRTRRATTTAQPETNRTAAYSQGLATIGMGLFLLVRSFDDFDLHVLNTGGPNLAAALDAVGERHKAVRDACDLILGGGTGGPYVQLLFASLAVGVPIAAHHGWLPATAGERFGALANVTMPDVPRTDDRVVPEPDVDHREDRQMGADEIISMLTSMPDTVAAEVGMRLMGADRPIGVAVPFAPDADHADDRLRNERLPRVSIPTQTG